MKWEKGQKVHFNSPYGGANARILMSVEENQETYWIVETIPEKQVVLARENELVEGWRGVGE